MPVLHAVENYVTDTTLAEHSFAASLAPAAEREEFEVADFAVGSGFHGSASGINLVVVVAGLTDAKPEESDNQREAFQLREQEKAEENCRVAAKLQQSGQLEER